SPQTPPPHPPPIPRAQRSSKYSPPPATRSSSPSASPPAPPSKANDTSSFPPQTETYPARYPASKETPGTLPTTHQAPTRPALPHRIDNAIGNPPINRIHPRCPRVSQIRRLHRCRLARHHQQPMLTAVRRQLHQDVNPILAHHFRRIRIG